ncbi:hypothetical protein [Pseudorhodobacter ferrugineus]|uniref:hypothetical protein n=1 Tax=Pseudorhodobacter ferrugineus TaxID=77008 RepID=UPI0003B718FD|nr:hypothetical protein [Pseudorhodobacter ferrugineus]
MIQPQLILHIGAPKCGSSALQAALTKMPDMTGQDGRRFRYVSTLVQGGTAAKVPFSLTPLYGAALTHAGLQSPYGYTCCPNMADAQMVEKFTRTLRTAHANGKAQSHIPILSNEGWIYRHANFAKMLELLGNPPVDVVTFLRPPVEWLNASYWQWGVWSAPSLNAWMTRANMTYSFGMDLVAWSQIPNVRLRVYPSKPDVVAHFAGLYGLPLTSGHDSNRSSPPALIGFLLRNRRFRPSAHQPATEFIFQRWCPKLAVRQPWAVGSAQVLGYRPIVRDNLAALRSILSPQDCDRLFEAPRWQAEKPYHEELLVGPTLLDDPTDLPALWDSLQAGIIRAGGAANRSMPPMGAPLVQWDAALCGVMDQLIACDKRVRNGVVSPSRGRKIVDGFKAFWRPKADHHL